jgi:ElaB/YqjD/DUF883 family membrane-anchored ribosome-binding protein
MESAQAVASPGEERAMEKPTDEVTERVAENFDELREELGDRAHELRETVNNYVDANPLLAVGVAFGVGYLLSGALFSRTTFKAATIGGRFVFGGFLKQLIAGIGPGMVLAAVAKRHGQGEASHASGGQGNGNGNGNGNRTQR